VAVSGWLMADSTKGWLVVGGRRLGWIVVVTRSRLLVGVSRVGLAIVVAIEVRGSTTCPNPGAIFEEKKVLEAVNPRKPSRMFRSGMVDVVGRIEVADILEDGGVGGGSGG